MTRIYKHHGIHIGGRLAYIQAFAIDDWWIRIFGRGVSIEPIEPDHFHLFSIRYGKPQPLHVFGHCIKYLKKPHRPTGGKG